METDIKYVAYHGDKQITQEELDFILKVRDDELYNTLFALVTTHMFLVDSYKIIKEIGPQQTLLYGMNVEEALKLVERDGEKYKKRFQEYTKEREELIRSKG